MLVNGRRVERKNYGKIKDILEVPNLIRIQLNSFRDFLQPDVEPEKRENKGLQKVFNEVFPIHDFYGTASLEFVKYELGKPKYSPEECVKRVLPTPFLLRLP